VQQLNPALEFSDQLVELAGIVSRIRSSSLGCAQIWTLGGIGQGIFQQRSTRRRAHLTDGPLRLAELFAPRFSPEPARRKQISFLQPTGAARSQLSDVGPHPTAAHANTEARARTDPRWLAEAMTLEIGAMGQKTRGLIHTNPHAVERVRAPWFLLQVELHDLLPRPRQSRS